MIQMQKFYTELSRPTESEKESYRRLRRIKEAQLHEILVIRSQIIWEQWNE